MAEDLHLTKLFVECGGACFGWRLRPLIKHLLVPVDEERLRQSYYFDTNVQRDGYDRVKHDCVRKENEQGDYGGAGRRRLGWDKRIPGKVRAKVLASQHLPHTTRDGAK